MPDPMKRGEARDVAHAVRERWPIPEEKRAEIVERLLKTMNSGEASDRDQIAAAKALQAMDRLNMEQERRDQKIPDYHELSLSPELESQIAKIYGIPE